MDNIKKKVLDLKYIIDRGGDTLSKSTLDKIQDILLKAYEEDPNDDMGDGGEYGDLSTFDPYDMGDEDDEASAFLRQFDNPKEEAPKEETQQEAPKDKMPEISLDGPKVGDKEKITRKPLTEEEYKKNLHRIHNDEDYRKQLKDYSKEYLSGEYTKIIRDAQASSNPDKATTGHAYHLANPQHSMGSLKAMEEVQSDPEFQKLSPREQHMRLAQAQTEHFESNPNHKDEFVASGRERNEYALAAKKMRSDKLAGEREDISRGGTTATNDASGASNEAVGQAIGGESTDQGTTANIQTTPEARMSSTHRVAAQVYEKEQSRKKLADMMDHNETHGADNPMHAQRKERMKGMLPDSDKANDIVNQVSSKMDEKRSQDQQAAIANRKGNPTSASHPKEQLAAEYMPKMHAMARKMISGYGQVASDVKPEDLSRHGHQGLWEAVRDFDPQVHNFKGLAARRMKARMKDELNQQVNVSKPVRQEANQLQDAQRVLNDLQAKQKQQTPGE